MYAESELELVGAIIGDGHIHKKRPKYYFGLTGNKITDWEYFYHLSGLIKKTWNKNAKVFESGRGLRIRIYSKAVVERLTNVFSIPYNSGKCYSVSIPEDFLNDFSACKYIIRGIADTDGSVFVSDKPGSPNYPSLEITTVSETLAIQLRQLLLSNGFRVTNLRHHPSKRGVVAYKVCLYGKANLVKWLAEIGFSNPVKLAKALNAINAGF